MRTYQKIASVWTVADMFECSDCGAVVKNQAAHEAWHQAITKMIHRASIMDVIG